MQTKNLSLGSVATIPESPVWESEHMGRQKVGFRLRINQVPLGQEFYVSRRSYNIFVIIEWNDEAERYEYTQEYAAAQALPEKPSQFRRALKELLDEQEQKAHKARFMQLREKSRVRMPRQLRQRLYNEYGTLYDLLSASDSELRSIPDMGESRIEALREGHAEFYGEKHIAAVWLIDSVCPVCEAEWRQPLYTKTPPEETDLLDVLFCPACKNSHIPEHCRLNAEPYTHPSERP